MKQHIFRPSPDIGQLRVDRQLRAHSGDHIDCAPLCSSTRDADPVLTLVI